VSRQTHDREHDHHGTELATYVVIEGDIGPYLSGRSVQSIIGSVASGAAYLELDNDSYIDSGLRLVDPVRYLGAARRSVVSGWDSYMAVDAPNSGGYFRMSAYDDPAGHSAQVQGSGSSGWLNLTATDQVRINATKGLLWPRLAADPSPAEEGLTYFNTTTKKYRGYDGTTWSDLN
jgi:hypothetical protein